MLDCSWTVAGIAYRLGYLQGYGGNPACPLSALGSKFKTLSLTPGWVPTQCLQAPTSLSSSHRRNWPPIQPPWWVIGETTMRESKKVSCVICSWVAEGGMVLWKWEDVKNIGSTCWRPSVHHYFRYRWSGFQNQGHIKNNKTCLLKNSQDPIKDKKRCSSGKLISRHTLVDFFGHLPIDLSWQSRVSREALV